MTSTGSTLSPQQRDALLGVLKVRFESNMSRHPEVAWAHVESRLAKRKTGLWSLNEMEQSGGEPDVVAVDATTGECQFVDCSRESPSGRRSLCYDRAALDARRQAKPRSSAIETAAAMGVELLTDDQYRALQSLGTFDLKTSSWIATPTRIRALGGALFCDRRYDTVFTYHNGAESYYAARGFRALLRV